MQSVLFPSRMGGMACTQKRPLALPTKDFRLCEKNMRLLSQFDDQRKFEARLGLPDVVLAELEKVRKAKRSPTMLEVFVAQTAVYVEILNTLPIRIGSFSHRRRSVT